jgi:uncharacterized protein
VGNEADIERICSILKETKSIAVVGISDKPDRISRIIAEFLLDAGYKVAGVNPNIHGGGGRIPIYPDLSSIPYDIDLIDVFRRPETIGELIPSVLDKRPKTLWLQQGIRNDEAVKPALESGIEVVQDKCIMVFYRRCQQKSR